MRIFAALRFLSGKGFRVDRFRGAGESVSGRRFQTRAYRHDRSTGLKSFLLKPRRKTFCPVWARPLLVSGCRSLACLFESVTFGHERSLITVAMAVYQVSALP